MRRIAVIVLLVALLALPALAKDFVATPIADHPGAGHIETHFIEWNLSGAGAPANAQIYEVFVGVNDRVEVDAERWEFDGISGKNLINASWWLVNESADHPSLVVGATNLTGSSLPRSPHGMGFDSRVNPFIISAYNLTAPKAGPPSMHDPIVRLYGGYGWNWHDDKLFGGMQLVVDPRVGFAVMNYQGQPAYLVGFKPTPQSEIHVGWFHGDPLVHVGYNWDLKIF